MMFPGGTGVFIAFCAYLVSTGVMIGLCVARLKDVGGWLLHSAPPVEEPNLIACINEAYARQALKEPPPRPAGWLLPECSDPIPIPASRPVRHQRPYPQ